MGTNFFIFVGIAALFLAILLARLLFKSGRRGKKQDTNCLNGNCSCGKSLLSEEDKNFIKEYQDEMKRNK